MSDTKYLMQRGELWMFHWRVPSDCRAVFGGKRFVSKSLETHSIKVAQDRRTMMLAKCLQAVNEHRTEGVDVRSLFRANLALMKHASDDDLDGAWLAVDDKEPQEDKDIAYREALKVTYLGHNSELAKCTLKDALKAYEEEKEGKITSRTLLQAARAVTTYLDFVHKDDVILSDIPRRGVKLYIRASSGYAGNTIKNRVALLSSIFKVALNDELISDSKRNPFEGHQISKGKVRSYKPFTPDQLVAILKEIKKYKESPETFHKYFLPRLAYATGCRIEELCSLQRAQVKEENGIVYLAIAEGTDVYKGKTLNAGRRIPVHSSLAGELLEWRDSTDDHLLFPELKSNRADEKLGDKFSKQFGVIKRRLGITERDQSFHSFRVHTATNLEQAEVPENRAVWIMGHTRTVSMSYGLYSTGPSLEQLRDDVEKCVVWTDQN